MHRLREAADEFLKSIRADQHNLEARICLAKAYAQRGQSKTALEILLKLVEENPQFLKGRLQLALLYYSLGDTVEAQIEFNQAHALDPNNPEVKMYLSLASNAKETTVH